MFDSKNIFMVNHNYEIKNHNGKKYQNCWMKDWNHKIIKIYIITLYIIVFIIIFIIILTFFSPSFWVFFSQIWLIMWFFDQGWVFINFLSLTGRNGLPYISVIVEFFAKILLNTKPNLAVYADLLYVPVHISISSYANILSRNRDFIKQGK